MEIQLTQMVMDKIFFDDGSFRDIYVLDTEIKDWQKFFEWVLSSPWNILFYKEGNITVFEEKEVAKIFEEKENDGIHRMSIEMNGVTINCHFFTEDELEFDIDPIEVKDVSAGVAIFEFMRQLSKILGKESILTEENCPKYPLVTAKSDGKLIFNI